MCLDNLPYGGLEGRGVYIPRLMDGCRCVYIGSLIECCGVVYTASLVEARFMETYRGLYIASLVEGIEGFVSPVLWRSMEASL
jgi:hypothetical protein